MKKLFFSLLFLAGIATASTAQTSISPDNGNRGQSLPIIISGQAGGFSQGSSVVILAQGSYTLSSALTNSAITGVTVTGSNTIKANLAIPTTAPLGNYDLFVYAGTSTMQAQAFTVHQGTPTAITTNPDGGKPGESLTNVTVTVTGADFKATGQSGVESTWLTHNTEIIDGFSNIQVINSTSFSADLVIPANATQTMWDVNVYTHNGMMYSADAIFNIDEEIGLIEFAGSAELALYPNPGSEDIHVEFEPQMSGKIQFRLFSLNGKHIGFSDVSIDQKEGTAQLKVGDVPKGSYVLQMLSEGKLLSSRMWIRQ